MTEIVVEERTRRLLEEPLLDGDTADAKIRELVAAEYLRRLRQYERQKRNLEQKYAMDFDAFIARRVVEQRGYSWEVEQDGMTWETAIGGIATLRAKLEELRGGDALHEA